MAQAAAPFWDFPYPSRRMPLLARSVVSTSQPLAASDHRKDGYPVGF